MRRIVCADCKQSYDYDKEDFCPRCGAFNQPVKTWGMDARGNVVRVDGVNESTHAGSFVHREVHREKAVRKAVGLDQSARQKPRQPVPARTSPQRRDAGGKLKAFFVLLAIILFFNLILPLLMALW